MTEENSNNLVWDHETVLHLIDLYRECPALWNPQDRNYHLRNKKNDAWEKIAAKLKYDVGAVKNKMNSLL